MTNHEFRAARKRLGMLQRELAAELGITEQQIRNLENGRRDVKKTVELAMELLEIRAELI